MLTKKVFNPKLLGTHKAPHKSVHHTLIRSSFVTNLLGDFIKLEDPSAPPSYGFVNCFHLPLSLPAKQVNKIIILIIKH